PCLRVWLRRPARAGSQPTPCRSRHRRPAPACRRNGRRRTSSCDYSFDLEVHNGVPIQTELGEDLVAVLVELRSPSDWSGLAVILHRGGNEAERKAGRRLAVLDVA